MHSFHLAIERALSMATQHGVGSSSRKKVLLLLLLQLALKSVEERHPVEWKLGWVLDRAALSPRKLLETFSRCGLLEFHSRPELRSGHSV